VPPVGGGSDDSDADEEEEGDEPLLAIEKRAKILDRKRYNCPPCLLYLSCDLVLWLQVAAAHVSQRARCNVHVIGPGLHCHCCSMRQCVVDNSIVTRYISLYHCHVVCGVSELFLMFCQ